MPGPLERGKSSGPQCLSLGPQGLVPASLCIWLILLPVFKCMNFCPWRVKASLLPCSIIFTSLKREIWIGSWFSHGFVSYGTGIHNLPSVITCIIYTDSVKSFNHCAVSHLGCGTRMHPSQQTQSRLPLSLGKILRVFLPNTFSSSTWNGHGKGMVIRTNLQIHVHIQFSKDTCLRVLEKHGCRTVHPCRCWLISVNLSLLCLGLTLKSGGLASQGKLGMK